MIKILYSSNPDSIENSLPKSNANFSSNKKRQLILSRKTIIREDDYVSNLMEHFSCEESE